MKLKVMKEVVLKLQPVPEVVATNIINTDFVGFITPNEEKGVITRIDYKSFTPVKLGLGLPWGEYFETKQEAVKGVLKNSEKAPGYKVFIFLNEEELLKWLLIK